MKIELNENRYKDTGLAIILILLLFSLATGKNVYWHFSVPVLVLTMTVPRVFKWPAKGWFGFSHVLGTIMSKVLLTIVFSLIIFPLALLLKVFGKDAMQRKKWRTDNDSSFSVQEPRKVLADDFKNIF